MDDLQQLHLLLLLVNHLSVVIVKVIIYRIIHLYHKGRFTQDEIIEVVLRFNKGQSLNKIAREMERSREAVRRHLIRLGYIPEPEKRKTVVNQTNWFDVIVPNFNTCLFLFMTISMILSFPSMCLMSLALIILISD